MSDMPFIPWRPGLPSEPCVCDVRFRGEEHRNAKLVELYGPNCARFLLSQGPGVAGPFDVVVGPYVTFEWRPILIPDGVLGNA